MACENCTCGNDTQGASQPGSQEAQRLQREATKSKPGPTTGADIDDSPEPGTEDLI